MIPFTPLSRPLASLVAVSAWIAFSGSNPLWAPPFTLEGPGVDPADFRVTVFADGLDFPLGMAELSDGSIIATVSEGTSFFNSNGKLVRFVDSNGDGVADGSPQVLYDDLPGSLTSVCVGGELVFVVGVGRPLTILRKGETSSDPLTFVGRVDFNYPGTTTYHAHSALELRETPGVDDSYDLFFQIGSDSNFAESTRTVTIESSTVAGVAGTLVADSAYMMTIVDEGSQARMSRVVQVGAGLRNAAGFTFHPATGDLYLQDNGIDGLEVATEPHSADELNFIAREDVGREPIPDFGFPDNYIAYRTGEVVGGEGVQPVIAFQPVPDPQTGRRSEGPNDITFAPPGFPDGLNTGIFLGFHGIFNQGGLANDQNAVVYADPETGGYFHFIHGQQEGIGHPDGLLATRNTLFVADMTTGGNMNDGAGQGVIYQIKALTPPVPPDLAARRAGPNLELTWDRGVLQQTDDLEGEWQDVDQAFSPFVADPEGKRRFFRVVY